MGSCGQGDSNFLEQNHSRSQIHSAKTLPGQEKVSPFQLLLVMTKRVVACINEMQEQDPHFLGKF